MLSKCANPLCDAEFYSLRHGRLFVLDGQAPRTSDNASGGVKRQPEQLEYFWLCDRCCKSMRVTIDPEHRIVVTSFEDPRAEPLHVLPPLQSPAARHSARNSNRRLRRPFDSISEGAGGSEDALLNPNHS